MLTTPPLPPAGRSTVPATGSLGVTVESSPVETLPPGGGTTAASLSPLEAATLTGAFAVALSSVTCRPAVPVEPSDVQVLVAAPLLRGAEVGAKVPVATPGPAASSVNETVGDGMPLPLTTALSEFLVRLAVTTSSPLGWTLGSAASRFSLSHGLASTVPLELPQPGVFRPVLQPHQLFSTFSEPTPPLWTCWTVEPTMRFLAMVGAAVRSVPDGM